MKQKNMPFSGQGQTHSEFIAGVNTVELKFHGQAVIPFDNSDGKIWFTAKQAAKLLGYTNAKAITNLYNRNKDEFTLCMSQVIKVMTNGINNNLRKKNVRIFSPRGLHLLGFLADTTVAKEVRKWALDLIENETQPQGLDLANLSFASLKDLSVKQITDFLVKAEEYSKRENGTKGSMKMHRRKKEKKAIESANQAAKQFIHFTLDLEFADGEACE